MKEKSWNSYTTPEQQQILNHWLDINITNEISEIEIKECKKIIEEKPNDVYRVAIASHICGETIESFVEAVRNKNIDELFFVTVKKDELDEIATERYMSFEQSFINMIVENYNEKEKNKTKFKTLALTIDKC